MRGQAIAFTNLRPLCLACCLLITSRLPTLAYNLPNCFSSFRRSFPPSICPSRLASVPGMQGLAMKCRVGGTPAKSDELRKNLYEAILLLTRTRIGREFLRGANRGSSPARAIIDNPLQS